ncbi:transglycosylase SLT domain-containing protein [Pseudomonas asplenii]|uniref:transglycosylase SLT domain-containing protein n=1 Tax=Pseudomonas asplenii TaxID=53407 RepID=UPI0006B51FFA|nr:transglycosylase SLT domain-containing protein [Pseudomonas fuscovaginae]KPA96901.1 soluble lytic murein transglycosylase-like protein [Pseudomonas fuscovaginae]
MNSNDEYSQVLAHGTPYDSLIRQEADREGVPYDFAHKLIFNESRFDPSAKSPTGPLGLGQMTAATGRAYGLTTPEDRMDASKAIPALMRHLKDLKGAYGGDLLKTALAYNQGQGRLGAPQLDALDQGDFSKISHEGQQYMRNLLDVAGDSPSRKYFDSMGVTDPGIHPKAKAVSFEDATQGLTANNPVRIGDGLPGLGAMGLKGGETPVTQDAFLPKDKTFFEGTGEATKASVMTSPIPSIFRYATQDTVDPLEWANPSDTSEWTRDDFEMIRKEGVDPQYFGFIMDYSKGKRANLPQAIAMAKENAAYDARIGGAGTGAQLVGGFISAGVDPLTYAPIPGATGTRLVSRVAQGAAYGSAAAVASEGLRESATGIEGHYGSALVGGALFGAGATALFDRAAQRAVRVPREDMSDEQLQKVLAMHGESALPNQNIDSDLDMLPSSRKPKAAPEMDDSELEAILARHGERGPQDNGRSLSEDDYSSIFERHGESFESNSFAGPAIRLEARETARQVGADDPSRMPWLAGEHPENIGGIDVVDHPSEPGAVRLQDGSILSANNPLNPKTIRDAAQFMSAERAAKGASMGGFTEIGYTLLRSENPGVRDIGGQLFRSPTGTVSGSNGKFGATASDIIERTAAQDHVSYNKMAEQLVDAIKDPMFATQPGGRQAHMDMVNRRVAEAIEDATGNKLTQLTPGERKLMETVRDHYARKADYLAAPAQFGNRNARAILPETRHAGSYIPNVYSSAAKALHLRRFGNSEGLQHAIMESWLASYAARPHVKARVDKLMTDTALREGRTIDAQGLQDAVEDYARRKAYGIAKSEDFDGSTLLSLGEQGSIPGNMGLASNNFLEGRHLFDSDMVVPLSDGSQFAVNDLREFDLSRITPSYDRRVNGDIGIMGATGRSTGELLHDIGQVKVTTKAEKAALAEAIKILTGQARRDPEGTLATTARILSDLGFVAKNAYMGVQSLSEVAGMITKGHTHMLLKGVPLLREMTQWGSKISRKDLKDMHSMVFGRELDNHIRPTRMDIIARLRDQADVSPLTANVLGSLKYATQEISARSPFTKFLMESSNYIADAGRSGVLSDLVDHVLAGRQSKLFEPQRLHSMSISPEQFEGIKDAIREHMVVSKGGKYSIKDWAALQRDPRTMDMWRLGDKIAHETILRPHALSSADTVAYGAGVKMAMQFKNFTLRSVNARLVRGFHDATKNGRAIDQTMQAVLSTGLAVSTYVAMKYSQASGMPKDQREGFLKNSLDPKMLAYAGLSRSSHIGAPLGLLNIVSAPFGFDQGAAVRSSILPRGPKEKPELGAMKYSATQDQRFTGFLGRVTEQVPAVGVLANAYQTGYNAFGALGSDSRRADQEYMTGVFNGLRGLVPNDPITQKLLLMMMESQGVEIR